MRDASWFVMSRMNEEKNKRTQKPPVWLDMDQGALDAAYDQSVYAPNMQQILERCAANSGDVRTRIGAPGRYSYGPASIEKLDVYRTPRPDAPINIFIHGGAWRTGSAKDFAFPAELFVHAGAHYVVPDFASAVDVGGNLMAIAAQVRRAVAWVHSHAGIFGGNSSQVFISGFSSGAHLAGVLLTTNWAEDFNLPPDVVKGGVCCSGMFDLEPVRLSARSSYIHFTDATEEALSPQRHLDKLNAPVVVAYGTFETPEFQRQSQDFAAAAIAAGKSVRLLVGRGYNHFEMLETLANPYGLLGRAILDQMNLPNFTPWAGWTR